MAENTRDAWTGDGNMWESNPHTILRGIPHFLPGAAQNPARRPQERSRWTPTLPGSSHGPGLARTLGNLGRLAPGRSDPYTGVGDVAANDPRSPAHGSDPSCRLGRGHQ